MYIPAMMLAISFLWTATVVFLVIRAVVQYQSYRQIIPRGQSTSGHAPGQEPAAIPADFPLIAVIVPARNEAENIERCLMALLQQDYPAPRMKVIVVDDDSTDGTAHLVEWKAGNRPRVELIEAGPLPRGWKGKPHACAVGAARAADAEWLCFIDADTFAEPGAISEAVRAASANGLDMLSLEPFQELKTFWERLIIPCGFFVMAFSHDLRRVNDPAMPDAVANGQFILIRRGVYESIGGHSAVRGEICEDSALARKVKSSGHRLAVWGAEALLKTRMYRDLPSLWSGLVRSVSEMVGGSRRVILIAAIGLTLAVASVTLPIIGIFLVARSPGSWTNWLAAVLAWIGSATMIGIHIGGANYLRIPRWYGLLFPIGYCVGAALAIQSAISRHAGSVAWKGRVYAAFAPEAAGKSDMSRLPPAAMSKK